MRVHLTEWEWACCGDPFAVGDDVTFVVTRPGGWVRETYGDLGGTVDVEESHHEMGPDDAPAETVRGRVRSISALYVAHTVTREWRDPAQLAELEEAQRLAFDDARGRAGGADFLWMTSPVSPYSEVSAPIPGAVRTTAVDRVPVHDRDGAPDESATPDAGDALPSGDRDDPTSPVDLLSGYLVDIDPA